MTGHQPRPDESNGSSDRIGAFGSGVRRLYERVRIGLRTNADFDAFRSTFGDRPLKLVLGILLFVTVAFSLLRVGILDVYTESLVFMAAGITFGLLGVTFGVLFVVLHSVFDLIASADALTVKTYVGRLVSYVLLAVLVIAIPAVQRATYVRIERSSERIEGLSEQPWLWAGAAFASAVTVGGLVYLWTVMMPYLIRPVFESSPTPVAVQPLQAQGSALAFVAGLAAFVVAATYQRAAGVVVTPSPQVDQNRSDEGRSELIPSRLRDGLDEVGFNERHLAMLRRGVRYALLIVLLLGLITSAFDVALLAGAFVVGDLLAAMGRGTPLAHLVGRVPRSGRFVLALGVTYFLTLAIFDWHYAPFGRSEFFPFVIGIAVGLVVFRTLVYVDTEPIHGNASDTSNGNTRVSSALLVVFGLWILLLTTPTVVSADNCGSWDDCEQAGKAAAAAGAAGAAGGAAAAANEGGIDWSRVGKVAHSAVSSLTGSALGAAIGLGIAVTFGGPVGAAVAIGIAVGGAAGLILAEIQWQQLPPMDK